MFHYSISLNLMCVYLSEGIDLLVEKSSDLIFVDNLRKFKGKVNGMNFQPQFNVNNPLSKKPNSVE